MKTHRRSRIGAVIVLAAVSTLTVLFSAAAPVSAQTNVAVAQSDGGTNQFVEIDVETIGDFSYEDESVEAVISVTATRPVSGVLIVSNELDEGAVALWEFPIDVAAGSEVTVPVTLTTRWESVTADVQLISGDQVVADEELRFQANYGGGTLTVGIFGFDDVPKNLQQLHTKSEISTLELSEGLRGLHAVSTVVVDPVAVREMESGETDRRTLVAWVRGGGQLVVDGNPGSLDDHFEGVATANPNRFELGAGSIVYSNNWRDGIPVGGYIGSSGFQVLLANQGLGHQSGADLAELSGLRFPSSLFIAGVLGMYALLAGPVLFGVAKASGSRRLIWLGLPALSIITTVGVLAVGLAGQRGDKNTHITIAESGPNGSWASADLLMGGGFAGSHQLVLPEGWSLIGQEARVPRNIRLRPTSSSTEITADLPPNGYALLRVEGESSMYDGLLTITPLADDDGAVTAEVTNNSDVTFTEMVGFWGNARITLEDLNPGETVEFTIDSNEGTKRTMGEVLLWPRARPEWEIEQDPQFGLDQRPAEANPSTAAATWTGWRARKGPNGFGAGTLGVVGWTDQLPSPLSKAGRTAVVTRANLGAEMQGDTHYSGSFSLQDDQYGRSVRSPTDLGTPQDYRFTLGTKTDPSRLALDVGQQVNGLQGWTEQGWQHLTLPETGSATLAVPPDLVVDGEILLRSWIPEWEWGLGATVQLVASNEGAVTELSADAKPRFDHAVYYGDVMEEVSSPAATFTVAADDFVDGSYSYTGGVGYASHDVFSIELPAGTSAVVDLKGLTGDAYLEAFDENGELIASNDDFQSGNFDSQLTFAATESTRTIEVQASGSGLGELDYTILVEVEQ